MRSTHAPAKSPAATAVRWLVNLASLALLLVAVPMVAAGALGYERYVITGGSMAETIERGSLVFERPVPVDQLREGDVITYQPPAESRLSTLVTHRIHTIRHTTSGPILRTKGDANAAPDPWRFGLDAPTQPRVEVVIPQAGKVFIFLSDRTNRMLVIGIPAGLIALVSLRELIRGLRRPRRPALAPAGA